jgi:hypothetical protein
MSWLRKQAAHLRSLDSGSGDAVELEKAADQVARLRRIERDIRELEFTVREQADTTRDQFLVDLADDLKRIGA